MEVLIVYGILVWKKTWKQTFNFWRRGREILRKNRQWFLFYFYTTCLISTGINVADAFVQHVNYRKYYHYLAFFWHNILWELTLYYYNPQWFVKIMCKCRQSAGDTTYYGLTGLVYCTIVCNPWYSLLVNPTNCNSFN